MSRKVFVLAFLAIIVAVGVYKLWGGGKGTTAVAALEPMKPEGTSDVFTQSLTTGLQYYFTMKDAFVKGDTITINQQAGLMAASLDALNPATLKADTTLISLASGLAKNVAQSTREITDKSTLEEKRKAFQSASDGLYDLLRTVQYKGGKVYQQFCPMAFDNTGAAWLSSHTEIMNPYFGDKMLHCGEIRDSLSF